MARDTSVEAYNEIKNNNRLTELQLLVYDCLYHHGPLSAMEVHLKSLQPLNSISPRFSPLRDKGVIKEVGSKISEQTGKRVIIWDVTSKLPEKKSKKLTKYEALLLDVKNITKEMKEQGPLFFAEAILALEMLQEEDPF